MRLYRDVLGAPTLSDRAKAVGLVITGGVEFMRLQWEKMLGRESIVYQPPCRRMEYKGKAAQGASQHIETREATTEHLTESDACANVGID